MRKGLQAYAHGGLSFINNSSSVNYNKNNSVQIQYGAGVEYGLNDGLALRAGIDLYDKDASMVFVGVLKRFGTKSKRKVIVEPVPEPVIETAPEPVIEPAPEPEIIVPVVVLIQDADNDGVIDADDQCADSPENITVDDKGCSSIFVEIEGVNFEPNSFDLIWSEGAIYNIGFEKGLKLWKPLLKPNVYIAVTEISWFKQNPPYVLSEFWNNSYSQMLLVDENIKITKDCCYKLVDHFTLPESDWWNYYDPLMEKLELLRAKYSNNKEALTVMKTESQEIELYRKYSDFYGYEFYIMQKY